MMEEKEKILNVLRSNNIFNSLTAEELKSVLQITSMEEVAEGGIVFSKKQEAHFLFLLMEGLVQSSVAGSAIHVIHPGEVFGEIGIINQSIRTGEVSALRDSEVIKIDGHLLFDATQIPATTCLKIVRGLARKVSSYLIAREQVSTSELIKMGEDDNVEYK